MFLNMLDYEEKIAFTKLAQQMIEADGVVVGRETTALAALKAEMGIAGTGDDHRSIQELCGAFKSKQARGAVVFELLGLAYSDTAFDYGEQTLLASIAHDLGFDAEGMEEFEQWIQDHVALVRRAMALMRD